MDQDSVRQLVEKKLAEMDKGVDYYTLLEIPRDVDTAKVKRAYFGMVKLVHPDVVRRLGDEELLEKSKQVFQALTQAFRVLSDPRERAKYAGGQKGTGYTAVKRTDKKEEARLFFLKGKALLDRRAYAQARKALEQAVKLNPKEGQYYLHLGLAWFYDPDVGDDVRLPRSRKYFEKALELNSEDPKAHYAMALYYKTMGEFTMEYQELEDALMLDPDYLEAKREMRLLSMRWKKNKASSLSSQWADFVTSLKRLFAPKENKKKGGKGKKK